MSIEELQGRCLSSHQRTMLSEPAKVKTRFCDLRSKVMVTNMWRRPLWPQGLLRKFTHHLPIPWRVRVFSVLEIFRDKGGPNSRDNDVLANEWSEQESRVRSLLSICVSTLVFFFSSVKRPTRSTLMFCEL
jgi:hypothetical protein